MTSTAKKTSHQSESTRPQEATKLLRADHKLVNTLFLQYESSRSKEKKKALIEQICQELIVHAQIEEEIFYPKVQTALNDTELVPEARVEHETLKHLIAQLEDGEPGDEEFEAKVKVLSEYVKHHVREEQKEIFPKVQNSKLDLEELGAELAQRKEELKDGSGNI
ncbi:hemerythrin domain-containing protein [Cellvibrio mixtus]|uniref:hemerythrin domain-containing protein n=1 Tax=Cellvibrio mixtus TaxID=39650 RepID=UPI000587F898|nr:hemerythrin domain-containing protein [Cellvibrio mixtus]